MSWGRILTGIGLVIALLVLFVGSGGGFASAFGGFGSGAGYSGGGAYGGYRGFQGSTYDTGWKDALNSYDLLQEKIDSYNRKVQIWEFDKFKTWGAPSNECTSKETWTQRCGYHR